MKEFYCPRCDGEHTFDFVSESSSEKVYRCEKTGFEYKAPTWISLAGPLAAAVTLFGVVMKLGEGSGPHD